MHQVGFELFLLSFELSILIIGQFEHCCTKLIYGRWLYVKRVSQPVPASAVV